MMKQVLVLGAHGKIARLVTAELLKDEMRQRLFLRCTARIKVRDSSKEELFEGDAANAADLAAAMQGIEIVYANLAGNIIEEAWQVTKALKNAGVNRLIWISTLGIYDEVPGKFGEWNHQMLSGGYLKDYAKAASIIETSGLDYTIIRPAWLTDKKEVQYETTEKGESFKGTEVSRMSVAALVADLIRQPEKAIGKSLGVNKPNTDGDKPSWY